MASAEFWWRSWHGAPMDHKYPVIAARAGVKVGIVSAVMWALLDYGSQQDNRGDVIGFDSEAYAIYTGFPEIEINAVIQAMNDKQIITDGHLTNWEKRQPKSEREIQRATANREKKRIETQKYEMLQNVTEKYTDTDTDTDTEKEEEQPPALFDLFQREVEKVGINLSGPADIKALQSIVDMTATIEDLHGGIAWKQGHSDKPLRYVSSIVEPTRTAMQKRLQTPNGHKPAKPAEEVFGGEVYQ